MTNLGRAALVGVAMVTAGAGAGRPSDGPLVAGPRPPVDRSLGAGGSGSAIPPRLVADGPDGPVAGGEPPWNQVALEAALAYAQRQRSSAVVVVGRGEVVAERYWSVDANAGSPYSSMLWGKTGEGAPIEDVASLQKSVVSLLVGIAVDQGLLDLDVPVSASLHPGWSNATCDQESAITARHLLSMTSGLTPALEYQAPAGSAWLYNTRAYSELVDVLEALTANDIGQLTRHWLTDPIGMHDTAWRRRPWVTPGMDANPIGLYSTARDLICLGELMLNGGVWHGRRVVSAGYVEAAVKPSQSLNPAYGLLWWLNGRPSLTAPEARGQATLAPAAPRDMVAAQGALGRKLYVVPSLELVVARMGDTPDDDFNRRFWELLMAAAPVPPV